MTMHATTADDIPVVGSRDASPAHDRADDTLDQARLMDHAYDGIREYDNPLPGWWNLIFAATFVVAFLYFAYYNIAGWGKTPAEKYQIALAGWQAGYRGGPGGGGPSVTEEMLAAGVQNPDVVARGAEVFTSRCIGCHAADGRGQIGPNLTDLYQIHGTTRLDLYGTILGGAPGTAMIAWGEVMKPAEIIAVATYVSSLRGKNLPGKEPQGKSVPALAP
ncbi:MAG: c-type cytochrome [Deltaproteobacteria bacterium]|nr:MAG: c-type cytochrome [Deltaproteobacteria bacterium]